MIHRQLNPSETRSFFLFAHRQTEKSTFVSSLLQPQDLYIALLSQETFFNYMRDPSLFRQEVLAHHQKHPRFTCIIDEIQKIPSLLDRTC